MGTGFDEDSDVITLGIDKIEELDLQIDIVDGRNDGYLEGPVIGGGDGINASVG